MPLEFTINGKPYSVKTEDYPADITLNTFIREYAKLFGTKFYCFEGGCGCCTVTVRFRHPVTHQYQSRGVYTCLTLLNICHGWDIVTIEGLGNRADGYHPLQERLAHFNGSQCGFCSPGFIMQMYSLLEGTKGKITSKEIENSFGGNLCRCTGYRPILDTMKSFASDCEYEFLENDIEDLRLCPKVGKVCDRNCKIPRKLRVDRTRAWYHPQSLPEVFDILDSINDSHYMLVAGNTSQGIYRSRDIEIFIDVNNVTELRSYEVGNVVELGGNMPLTEVIDVLKSTSELRGFEYFRELLKHLDAVASVQVRNLGTIAGNLMIKYEHNEFVSDIFAMLLTVDARIIIANTSSHVSVTLLEFLNFNMTRQIIVKIVLPQWDKDTTMYGTYKIEPRAQHSHAFVNAGFLFSVSGTKILTSRVVFGGINSQFNESTATKRFFKGRNLFDPRTFAEALNILNAELRPDWVLPAPSPEYRKKLALGLFYKFVIKNAPRGYIGRIYLSGGHFPKRPISSGTQYFDTKEELWPVNKPVRKLEAVWQCSGEAHFANDAPHLPDEVWAAFVPATRVLSTVASIDASEALAMEGVIAFYSAKDIPGTNSFVVIGLFQIFENEELFCADIVRYHSQPVGIILAKSNKMAQIAATKVHILYEHNERKKILTPTLKDVIANESAVCQDDSEDEFVKVKEDHLVEKHLGKTRRIRGHFELEGQFHFSIESHTTICIPRQNGLFLYSSTQHMDHVQASITNTLNLPSNRIEIEVRRLGGSFGSRISRCNHVAVGCALASWLSNRPVRFVQSIENNMRISGKRFPCICDYILTTNDKGKIKSFTLNFYEDMGTTVNESPIENFTIPTAANCYNRTDSWVINGTNVITDAPSNTWCRAPGTLEGIAMTENVMEHIARVVKMDPVDVRLNNIPDGSDMKKLLPDFIKQTDYRQRRKNIDVFNGENRWRKRGIAISLMRYPIIYIGQMSAAVAIYHYDGTVLISHGGIEMGQGVNTKAAQVAAYTLGIPLDMVTVKASNTFDGANSLVSGGSVTSETVCLAVRKACNQLLSRMKPIRDKLSNPTWLELVQKSHEENINLFSRQIHKAGDLQGYDVWGLACTEMEVDILTGKWQITRADIVEDTGESLSPLIDVGQIEGGFVQGLGYWLTEKLVYDRQTGELKTFNTWEYKVPGAKDIPIDFRVKLLQNRPNPYGFLRSKTTGEMGICMSICAVFALRHALDSARNDAGIDAWYELGAPTTIEDIVLAAGHTKDDFKLNS
ncbi:unnamed protein product [Hermetia illucens]|uniref:Indole-3-acetaldehyde oxidase n=1 Tax=Hermetia illucens TaxID=343691 RepID=A0A7R8YMD6_HERIL|nr:indole-3-acetaldehyde oxidase-like isoform X2 [Hermetia illucens]CAD7078516.1 unnamed protein product [Hermetia illucens]